MRRIVWNVMAMSPLLMAADSLDNSKWQLKDPAAPQGARAPVLTIEKGRFAMRVCNSISGPLKVDGSKLVAGPAISTMMACINPDLQSLEKSLTEAVTKNSSFALSGGELTLVSQQGSKYVFERMVMASPEAKTRFIYVAPTLRDCTAGVMKTQCLQVRESKDQPWTLHYGRIVGFDFVPGIEYRLRIKEDKVANPPADGSSLRWFLDMIVEQKVVDRKAVDAATKPKP